MTAPSFTDAKNRRLVVVSRPGRIPVTGRLLSLPGTRRIHRRSKGTRARVVLPSGAVLSVSIDQIDVLPLEASK